MQVSLVAPDQMEAIWPAAAPLLERVVKQSGGRWHIEDYLKSILNKSRQLWIVYEGNIIYAAILTSIEDYPQKRVLNYQAVGGFEMESWYHDVSGILHQFAKDVGCEGIETICRKGFVKKHKEHGFKETHVLMYKDI